MTLIPPDASAAPLDRVRAALLADEAAQDALAGIEDGDTLTAAVIAIAHGLGIAVSPAMLAAALRPDPLGIERFMAVAANAEAWPGPGWRPVGLAAGTHGPLVEWAHFAGRALTEPFFEDALRRARQRPFNRLMRLRTPLATFAQGAPGDLPRPDGLIFHMSRCGSTLVAQMLGALDAAITLSEPSPLDAIVQLASADSSLPVEEQATLLRAMAGALGRSNPPQRRLFIKLDSWHAMALPLFRRAFPDTPWVFLHRDPVEVLVSQQRARGVQTVPGVLPAAIHGVDPALAANETDYCAAILGRTCAAAADGLALGGGIAVDYATLPAAVGARILPHFGVAPLPGEDAKLAAVAERDAKRPGFAFDADATRKRDEAGAAIREAAARFMAEPCARLSAIEAGLR